MDAQDSLKTQVELHLRCSNLPRMDLLSKSDPFAVVYLLEDGEWREKFRTETIWNNEDPEWADHIVFDYRFESVQKLKFEIYDRDSKSEELSKQDYIGCFETTISAIMGSRGSRIAATLVNDRKKLRKPGTISIKGIEVAQDHNEIHFKFSATKVDRKNYMGLGKSDPFYEISRMQSDGSFVKVYRSEAIKKTVNPSWKPIVISTQRLCNGDMSRPLKIEIFDWEGNGSHQIIGSFTTSADELLQNDGFDIINEKLKAKKKRYVRSGRFVVESAVLEERHSFLEFIQGGLDLNLVVAIDFTASNGNPSAPESLHYTKNSRGYGNSNEVEALNEYQKAILSVGQILEDYDTDKMIPVYGFGGCLPHKSGTNHCFALNFDEMNPEVHKVDGIMEAYSAALSKVKLSGPTKFSEVLEKVVDEAEGATREGNQSYFVLLIITDGIINDMDETIRQIVKGASLPLSIIIAGVGQADFESMETLDGDDVRLSYYGKVAERDIVQFVPMRDFEGRSYTALAEATLEELPGQVTSYYGNRKIKPQLPREESVRNLDALRANVREEVAPLAIEVAEEEAEGGVVVTTKAV